MISIGLFTFKMLPEVLEYCMEPPEKIALELENFYNLPYRGKLLKNNSKVFKTRLRSYRAKKPVSIVSPSNLFSNQENVPLDWLDQSLPWVYILPKNQKVSPTAISKSKSFPTSIFSKCQSFPASGLPKSKSFPTSGQRSSKNVKVSPLVDSGLPKKGKFPH